MDDESNLQARLEQLREEAAEAFSEAERGELIAGEKVIEDMRKKSLRRRRAIAESHNATEEAIDARSSSESDDKATD